MSGIFGLIHWDGSPLAEADVTRMASAMASWAPEGTRRWTSPTAMLGFCWSFNTPEARHEVQPAVTSTRVTVSAARLDNRIELAGGLGRSACDQCPDGELARAVLETWGDAGVERLMGDWSLASWDLEARTLMLARDQHGHSSLYYHATDTRFAFASDISALLALPWISRQLDELPFLLRLIASPAAQGSDTVYREIKRLLPSHRLQVSRRAVTPHRYWCLEELPVDDGLSATDAVDAVRVAFDAAVSSRLRTPGRVAVALSGGLDSGAVAVTAARQLAEDGRRLPLLALTGVPLLETHEAEADEWSLAAVTAAACGEIEHLAVRPDTITPLSGVERGLAVHRQPHPIVDNQYWFFALLDEARRRGVGAVLVAQVGNPTLSWGGPRPTTVREAIAAHLPWLGFRVQQGRNLVRQLVGCPYSIGSSSVDNPWRLKSAVHPRHAKRPDVREADRAARIRFNGYGSRGERFNYLQPGRAWIGAMHAEAGASAGVEIRDPMGDLRVLSAVFAIPDHLWRDRSPRWLIREMTAGKLPDAVRLRSVKGRQAGDLLAQLRSERPRIQHVLECASRSVLAREYIDLEYLRRAHRAIDGPNRVLPMVPRMFLRGLAAAAFLSDR